MKCFNSFINLLSSKSHLHVKYGHVWEILNASLTLKAYFLVTWSSTDSMEMWKLGRRILPKIPSSFSSEDTKRETLRTLAYISRLPGNLLNLQLMTGCYFGRGLGKQTVRRGWWENCRFVCIRACQWGCDCSRLWTLSFWLQTATNLSRAACRQSQFRVTAVLTVTIYCNNAKTAIMPFIIFNIHKKTKFYLQNSPFNHSSDRLEE